MVHEEIRSLMCDIIEGHSIIEVEEIDSKIKNAYECEVLTKNKYDLLLYANKLVRRLENKGW